MLVFTVVTIFPEMFTSLIGHSILKKAQEKELIAVRLVDPRSYTADRHHVTDDYPYGGGQGMVMKPEPLVAAIEDIRTKSPHARVILLSPQGAVFNQRQVAPGPGDSALAARSCFQSAPRRPLRARERTGAHLRPLRRCR